MAAARGETYNYDRFRMSNYELGYFPGPKAGETANAETVRINDREEIFITRAFASDGKESAVARHRLFIGGTGARLRSSWRTFSRIDQMVKWEI